MNPSPSVPPAGQPPIDDPIREAAACWTVRRDRGLSAREAIEFELWLAADERHATAIRRSAAAWTLLDRIPENAGQTVVADTAGRPRRHGWLAVGGLAAAAALAVAYLEWWRPALPAGDAIAQASPRAASPQILTLDDGSVVRLNTGAEVAAHFTAAERRVQLVRGEAHFSVAKNPARPFIVSAGTIELRAVGTAFDVNLQSAAVEVLVTEGHVAVEKPTSPAAAARDGSSDEASAPFPPLNCPVLAAGQRAVVALAPISTDLAVVVTALNREEVARTLAWQESLLRFGGATLAQVAAEFERRSGQRLVLGDASLKDVHLGGRYRADDLEGFVRLLEENYRIQSERLGDGTIVLRWAPGETGPAATP